MSINKYLIKEVREVDHTYSTDFTAVITGIKKRLKHRVSFDVLKVNNENYVTKVGVRVPNSLYYTCLIGKLGPDMNSETVFGIKSFRIHKDRYNYDWGPEWSRASITRKIPRAVSIASNLEPLYDNGVVHLAVVDMRNTAEEALTKSENEYSRLDATFANDLTSYNLRNETTALVKQFIESSKAGQVASVDSNNPVLQKYDEYCTKKKELQEELTHLGERVPVHVIKLFNREDIFMRLEGRRALHMQMQGMQARLPSVSTLPQSVQTLVHTVNLMAIGNGYSTTKTCSVGVMDNAEHRIVEDHYVVFLPVEEAEGLREILHVPE